MVQLRHSSGRTLEPVVESSACRGWRAMDTMPALCGSTQNLTRDDLRKTNKYIFDIACVQWHIGHSECRNCLLFEWFDVFFLMFLYQKSYIWSFHPTDKTLSDTTRAHSSCATDYPTQWIHTDTGRVEWLCVMWPPLWSHPISRLFRVHQLFSIHTWANGLYSKRVNTRR